MMKIIFKVGVIERQHVINIAEYRITGLFRDTQISRFSSKMLDFILAKSIFRVLLMVMKLQLNISYMTLILHRSFN